jgi:hypothetical protein
MKESRILTAILKGRGTIVELFIAAVVIGLGVNLLASGVAVYLGNSLKLIFTTSVVLVALGFALIARKTVALRTVKQRLSGFFCLDRNTNELHEVPEYEYSEQMFRSFRSLFAENEAPKKLWFSDSISKSREFDEKSKTYRRRVSAGVQLIIEATEYFVLHELSIHLTDYFNKDQFDKDRLMTLSREDIPSVLFKNRFLDTFSRPMDERAAFVDRTFQEETPNRKISTLFGKNGIHYASFDLVLPKGAKVSRSSRNTIKIETAKFDFQFEVIFLGLNTTLPSDFAQLYLRKRFIDISTFQVYIDVSVTFRPLSLLSRSGWEYYSWLDSFLTKLGDRFSKERFVEQLDWNHALTVARVIEGSTTTRRKTPETQAVAADAPGSNTAQ